MNLQEISITDLIPQRPPFVMVDRLIECDQTDAYAEMTIVVENIFLDNGVLSAAGMMENMAQSCAARMGCVNMMRGETVKIGLIGDIRNFEILRHPHKDEKLTTHVHIVEDLMNLTLANVTMSVGNEIIASARMKIALIE